MGANGGTSGSVMGVNGGTSGGRGAQAGNASSIQGQGGAPSLGGAASAGTGAAGTSGGTNSGAMTGGAVGTAGQPSAGSGAGGGRAATGAGGSGGNASAGQVGAAGNSSVAGAASSAFTFFAFGDAHTGQSADTNTTFRTAMTQMQLIDPLAVFAFSNGDLVEDSTSASWNAHDDALALGAFHTDVAHVDAPGRYLALMDNHDRGFPTERSDWFTLWSQHLPAQASLGHNGADGVYYSLRYANVLFIALDSIHPSTAQTSWLSTLLASSEAKSAALKIAIFHEPVYLCTSAHPPFADGLPWVDLFEKNAVNLVLVSHTHTYERTCALRQGACQSDGKGVVYQQLGPVAANNFRSFDMPNASVSGSDAAGKPRTDSYSCSGAGGILTTSKTNINDFCLLRVEGCRIIGSSYEVRTGNTTPFETWEVDGCR